MFHEAETWSIAHQGGIPQSKKSLTVSALGFAANEKLQKVSLIIKVLACSSTLSAEKNSRA